MDRVGSLSLPRAFVAEYDADWESRGMYSEGNISATVSEIISRYGFDSSVGENRCILWT